MKIFKIFTFLVIFLSYGLFMGCDENMPVVKEVGVESVTLSEELSNGITMEAGTTIDIAWKVSLLPENATDRAESFSSSNVEVAAVNAKGELTANSPGTSKITISVGGKSVEFNLTVVDKIIVPATDIDFTISELELMTGTEYSLFAQVKILPFEANDGVNYTSSNPEIVSVDAEGILTAIAQGEATITVASNHDNSVNATLPVKVINFSGDYPRKDWTMTASHPLSISSGDAEKNSLTSALDGDITTNFSLVKPGKTWGAEPNRVSVPSTDALHFTIDMGKATTVNYFRIRHRNNLQKELFLRWRGFEQILGSDDGVNFSVIAEDVVVTNWDQAEEQETPDVIIPTSEYRYLKFYASNSSKYMDTSAGSTIQIQELYLGVKEE